MQIIYNLFFFNFFTLSILFSILGYGLLLNKFFLFKNKLNLGYSGLNGLLLLTIISYSTTFFFKHGYIHNLVIIIIGILLFIFFKKQIKKNENFYLLVLFLVTLIFLIIFKTHDDFPYYHLPYSFNLSENKLQFGLGHLNLGFRHHSSILFLNSLFYLPKVDFYLFNITNYVIFLFTIFILLVEINKNYKKNNPIFLFSIFFVFLLLLKFNRLSEYGTDLAGQLILIIIFLNIIKFLIKQNNKYLIKIFIYLIFISTIKIYFLIYGLAIFVFLIKDYFKEVKKLIFDYKLIIFSFIFSFLYLFHNFINTGCLVYPLSFTCFGDAFDWTLSKEEVNRMSLWLELWSKGGAGPNYVVQDQSKYISGINWIENWFQKYFFTKVSDYLLSLCFFSLVLYYLYFKNNNFTNSYYIKISKIFFFVSVIVILEWFLNHPSLRYGGYFPISLLFFSILFFISYKLNKSKLNQNNSKKKLYYLIIFLFAFFNAKNILRINFELNNYKSNFPFFVVESKKYENIYLEEKKIYSIANHYCWSISPPCTNSKINFRVKKDYIYFLRPN